MITGKNSIIPKQMMTLSEFRLAVLTGLAAVSLSAFMLLWGLSPF